MVDGRRLVVDQSLVIGHRSSRSDTISGFAYENQPYRSRRRAAGPRSTHRTAFATAGRGAAQRIEPSWRWDHRAFAACTAGFDEEPVMNPS